MSYSSSKLNKYEPGDIICYRLTGNDNSLLCNIIAKLQSTLKGCDNGHKNSIHMAIVTKINDDGVPMIAHIDEPDEKDLEHKNYKGRQVHGMPKIEPLSKGFSSHNLMVIRNKNPALKTAIARSAIRAVEAQKEKGASWNLGGASMTYFQTLFANSTAKKERNDSKNSMICTQFISDVMDRATSLVELNKVDLLNVDTKVAMPKVIEHTLKTEHANDYDFLIKPLDTNVSFASDVLQKIEKISPDVAEKLQTLNDDFNSECRYSGVDIDFDAARILLFFAKEILPDSDYKKIAQHVKATYAVFNEDVSNIKLSAGKTEIQTAINEAKTELSNEPAFARAFKTWDLKQKQIENQTTKTFTNLSSPLLDQKLSKLDSAVTAIKMYVKTKEVKGKSPRTEQKLAVLNDFIDNFDALKETLASLDTQEQTALFDKVTAMQETIKALPNIGKTKQMLSHAVTVLNEIKEDIENITSNESKQFEDTLSSDNDENMTHRNAFSQ